MIFAIFGPPQSQKTKALSTAVGMCRGLRCNVLAGGRLSPSIDGEPSVHLDNAEQLRELVVSSAIPLDVIAADDVHALNGMESLLYLLESQSRRCGGGFRQIVVSGVARHPATGALLPWAQAVTALGGVVKEHTAPCSVCGQPSIHSTCSPDEAARVANGELLTNPTEWVPVCDLHFTGTGNE